MESFTANPRLMIATVAVAAGVAAAVALCLSKQKKPKAAKQTKVPVHAVDTEPVLTKKPKKRTRPTKKNSSDNLAEKVEEPVKELTKSEEKKLNSQAEAAEVEQIIRQIGFQEKKASKPLEKAKKSKETPEQKAARLERQKVVRSNKKNDDDEEVEDKEPTKIVAPVVPEELSSILLQIALDSPNDHLTLTQTNSDGWAVVEDKRKIKLVTKKPSALAAVDSTSSSAATDGADASSPVLVVDKTTVQVSVEGKKVGIIIGPRGQTLHSIQDVTETEISTPKDKDSKLALIGITGPAEGVALAVRIIEDLCNKGYSAALEGEDFSEGHVSVHPMYISDLVGKQGATRKAIQEFTSVRVNVPAGVSRDQPTNVKVGLAGPRAKVSEAKKLIKELMKYYHTEVTHPGLVHEEMDVAPALYNLIIGVRGSEIRHIQGNFKVNVYIPNENSITQTVLIVGEDHGVQGAKRYIQKIIDQAGRDRATTDILTDAWGAQKGVVADTDVREPWMEEFVHPSKRTGAVKTGSLPPGLEDSSVAAVEAMRAASLAAASQGAWGAAVVSSAEGW